MGGITEIFLWFYRKLSYHDETWSVVQMLTSSILGIGISGYVMVRMGHWQRLQWMNDDLNHEPLEKMIMAPCGTVSNFRTSTSMTKTMFGKIIFQAKNAIQWGIRHPPFSEKHVRCSGSKPSNPFQIVEFCWCSYRNSTGRSMDVHWLQYVIHVVLLPSSTWARKRLGKGSVQEKEGKRRLKPLTITNHTDTVATAGCLSGFFHLSRLYASVGKPRKCWEEFVLRKRLPKVGPVSSLLNGGKS